MYRDRPRGSLDSYSTPLPPEPYQRLSDRRRSWMGRSRYRDRQPIDTRLMGSTFGWAAQGKEADAAHRYPLSSGPHRACRLASRTLRSAAYHDPDLLFAMPEHIPQSRRVGREDLSRLLSSQRAEARDDRGSDDPGARLPKNGVPSSAGLSAHR